VEAVGDDAGEEAEDGERGEAADAEDADGEPLLAVRRELHDDPRERDVLHPRPAHGRDLAGEEEPVVVVAAEARERAAAGELEERHSSSSARSFSRAGSARA